MTFLVAARPFTSAAAFSRRDIIPAVRRLIQSVLVFTSLTFIAFFIVVFALYWQLGKEDQNRLIVLSGLVFYGSWDWRFAVLLLITTGIDFVVGLALEKEENERKRKAALVEPRAKTARPSIGLHESVPSEDDVERKARKGRKENRLGYGLLDTPRTPE